MTTSDDCPEKAELDTGTRARRLAARLRRRVSRARRDERGLTTLEWLLIVAAVAGLAALAVVLVTNVVDSTSEQISGSSARLTAARVAAQEIVEQASVANQAAASDTWEEWEVFYTRKCNRLEITYGDAGIDVTSSFLMATGDDATDPVTAIPSGAQSIDDTDDATSGVQTHAASSGDGAANCVIS